MTGFSVISFYLFIEICSGKSTQWKGMKNDLYPHKPEKWKNCEMGAYSFSSLSLKAGMSKDFVDVRRKAAHSH